MNVIEYPRRQIEYSIVRNVGEDSDVRVMQVVTELRMSVYYFQGLIDVLSKIAEKSPDNYVLLIGYVNERQRIPTQDYQLGFTETCKEGETKRDTLIRGLIEEVGFTSDEYEEVPGCPGFGMFDASRLKPCKDVPINNLPDIKNSKVCGIVYGGFDVMFELLQRKDRSSPREKDIMCHAAISIGFALRCLRTITLRYPEKKMGHIDY